jgi:hypothetical protein
MVTGNKARKEIEDAKTATKESIEIFSAQPIIQSQQYNLLYGELKTEMLIYVPTPQVPTDVN